MTYQSQLGLNGRCQCCTRKQTPNSAFQTPDCKFSSLIHAAAPSQGNTTGFPDSSQAPFFGLHIVKNGVGVISCAHLRHTSLASLLSVSNTILNNERNPCFSYNGFPIDEASIQHSTPNSSARETPTFISSEPMPWRRYAGKTAIQLSASNR